ncbi:MAG: hypothetical protein HZA61_03970 [Candidatus Eisenbacteria bacterium]|uniref:Uncharacterized protein n=1 Tax=Eiseniibacteriota bacterium TaxID=2212470 RepID=A0A933W855_UNCEI|nr:hypothetical protein [Candidatus Eisenbacteria bacterium]
MHGEDVGAMVIVGGVMLGGLSIGGGFLSAILRSRQRQSIAEMIQRERIAMIERGTEPDKLPAMQSHPLWAAVENGAVTERQLAARRRQGLIVAGLLFTCFGLALGLLLAKLAGDNVWAVGALPLSIGVALLLSSSFIKAE